jgi:hypothetical protein
VEQDETADARGLRTTNGAPAPRLDVGTRIYVRDRYLGRWCGGFEVAEVLDDGYRIRRTSDGHDFPDVFPFDDVHVERRQDPLRGAEGSHPDRRRFP